MSKSIDHRRETCLAPSTSLGPAEHSASGIALALPPVDEVSVDPKRVHFRLAAESNRAEASLGERSVQ